MKLRFMGMVGGTLAALAGVNGGQLLNLQFTDGFQDSSPAAHPIVASGEVRIEEGPTGFGQAARFDNPPTEDGITPQFLDCGEDPQFRFNPEMTVALWLKPTLPIPRDIAVIISNGPKDASDYGWRVFLRSTGSIGYSLRGLNGSAGGALGSSTTDEVWQHLAIVWNNGEFSWYRDGSLVGTTTANPLTPREYSHLWLGGVSGQDLGFNGGLDEVVLYDHALTADEVAALVLALDHRWAAPNQLTLRWSAKLPSASLQVRRSSAAGLGEWTAVPDSPTYKNGMWQVVVEASGAPAFYRLKKN